MLSNEEFRLENQTIDNTRGSVYLQFRLDHVKFFKGDCTTVTVLSLIINKRWLKQQYSESANFLQRNDGWFKCPGKEIQNTLCISEDRQQKSITKLVESGVIEIQRREGNNTWVRIVRKQLDAINSGEIIQIRENPDSGNSRNRSGEIPDPDPEKSRILIDKNSKELKEKRPAKNSRDSAPLFSTPFSKSCAVKLRESLREKASHRVSRRSTISRCSEAFAKLVKKHGEEDVTKTLDAYCKNIGVKFWPIANSGQSFSDKYGAIKDAMIREEQKNGIYVDRDETTKEKVDLPNGRFTFKYTTKTVKDFVPGKWIKGDDGKKKFVADRDYALNT